MGFKKGTLVIYHDITYIGVVIITHGGHPITNKSHGKIF